VETIVQMANICEQAEQFEDRNLLDADFLNAEFGRIDQSIAMGALFTAHHLGCKAIIALTDSGSTALWMSRKHVNIPIYALTTKITSQRKMALYRNIRPIYMDTASEKERALMQAENLLKDRGVLQTGDMYVITCGEPMGAPGGTNMLKICRVA
jgi:pyruvate kinase